MVVKEVRGSPKSASFNLLILSELKKKKKKKKVGETVAERNIHCLSWTKPRRRQGPTSEQREVLWSPAGPVSPSEEASEPPASLSHPGTKQPAAGTPPSHVSCWTGRPWTRQGAAGQVNYICVGHFQWEQHRWLHNRWDKQAVQEHTDIDKRSEQIGFQMPPID